MRRAYQTFIRGASVNGVSRTGIVLVTSSVLIFSVFEIFQLAGIINNAYIGLITYVAFPLIFLFGLFLLPLGWIFYSRKKNKTVRQLLSERFDEDELRDSKFGAKLFKTVAMLTLLNIVIIGLASARTLHYMEDAHFCGTACHSVMNPEWTTYQQSPHARVRCVECHVGEGVKATIDSKMNGVWQMISVTFNLYETPIPTPVHNLRPARETCEKCHWPEKFLGNRIVNRAHYDLDEKSTASYTTLMMKVGSGGDAVEATGIHWHVAPENEIRYSSLGDEREIMIQVESRQANGQYKSYKNTKQSSANAVDHQETRILDCVDCHNRATHIYEEPDLSIDERISRGLVDRNLPEIKKLLLAAVSSSYPDKSSARDAIAAKLNNHYKRHYPKIYMNHNDAISQAVSVAQAIYDRNIHPGMNISWGSYPSHLGHRNGGGCFRCHNPNIQDEEGNSISMDCTLCHSILAIEEDEPFKYIKDLDEKKPGIESQMHKYLQEEFWSSSQVD